MRTTALCLAAVLSACCVLVSVARADTARVTDEVAGASCAGGDD